MNNENSVPNKILKWAETKEKRGETLHKGLYNPAKELFRTKGKQG